MPKMKAVFVVIQDGESLHWFGYVKQFPGICAQGNSRDEVVRNIRNYIDFTLGFYNKDQNIDLRIQLN